MPCYDYVCAANGQTVEVRHRMHETVDNWGELCALAGIDPGDTDSASPVRRVLAVGGVVRSEHLRFNGAPCEMGGSCCGAKCGPQ